MIVARVQTTDTLGIKARLSSKRSKAFSTVPRYDAPGDGRIKLLESVTKAGPVYSWIDISNTTVVNADNYWFTNRYFGKDADTTLVEETGDIGISSNILAIQRVDGWSITKFKSVYLSPLVRVVLAELRKGGFDTSPRHLAQLPIIDNSVTDLYSHFKLTPEEIEYVESKA